MDFHRDNPRKLSARNTHGYRGFSLVEMLVVLGIVTVLAALVFSASTTALSKKGRLDCQQNLKQLWMGINAYATDNQNCLPGAEPGKNFWHRDIWPYVSDASITFDQANPAGGPGRPKWIYRCPLDATNTANPGVSYGMNDNLFGKKSTTRSSVALLMDFWNSYAVMGSAANAPNIRLRLIGRHEKHDNVLFMDGHIELFKKGSVPDGSAAPRFWGINL